MAKNRELKGGCHKRPRQMLKKTKKTKRAGRQAQEHRQNRPRPRAKQRRQQRPTSRPTRSNQDGRRASRRSAGTQPPHAPTGTAQATLGHAKQPARTNRTRATTRTHEPRTQPRGTGQQPKSGNRPRDKDTKKLGSTNTAQPTKKPPQPRKKPPQTGKRSKPNEQKTSQKEATTQPRTSQPKHPLYLKFRDPHGKI